MANDDYGPGIEPFLNSSTDGGVNLCKLLGTEQRRAQNQPTKCGNKRQR
jgi:hypothetical protein